MNKPELEKYFRKDKSDWFTIDNRGKKKWDEKKVTEFWEKFRKHYKNDDSNYIIDSICFPEFEFGCFGNESKKDFNFFFKVDDKTFKSDKVTFINCSFLSKADFSFIKVNELNLFDCIFYEEFDFHHSSCNNIRINHCDFKDKSSFQSSHIYDKIIIEFSDFQKEISFVESKINKLTIDLSNLKDGINLIRAEIEGECNMQFINIDGFSSFYNTQFNDNVFFDQVNFNDNVTFKQAIINKKLSFINVNFVKESQLIFDEIFTLNKNIISKNEYERANFIVKLFKKEIYYNHINKTLGDSNILTNKINFEEHVKYLLEKENLQEYFKILLEKNEVERNKIINSVANNTCFLNNPKMYFYSIRFPNTNFANCNLSKVSFIKCNISNVKFINSDFQSNNNRLILYDELNDNISLKELETTYRQLKKIFENDLNWENTNKAYVSEMYIRQKILKNDKDYLTWSMYKFYEIFAYYTQDFIRPFKWYIFSTFIFFPILYYLSYIFSNKFSLQQIYALDWNPLYYLQKSFAASLPLLSTNLTYDNWWLKSFQIILSTILITFFIFALRRKFRF